jgi:uncharacterized protein (TIGR01777 family)
VGIVSRAVVDAPIDEVFTWHARPGAISRLVPPWQPLTVIDEAASLRDGRAVLGLPGGVRWVAKHDPAAYDPPHRFLDRLDSFPLGAVLSWQHDHLFQTADGGGTVVEDRVDTAVPEALLRATFRYRTRQLADDLAAQRRAAAWTERRLTIAVSGATGTVGRALVPLLTTNGHRVISLVRRPARNPDERQWRPDDPAGDLLDGVDAAVHLAGAGIAGRFTASHLEAVRNSRIGPTAQLASAAARAGVGVFVCASAIGYYGPDRGDEPLTEETAHGTGFLAELVADWEEAAAEASGDRTRSVQIRTGLVQTPRGGALRLQRPLFQLGLGGRLGSGDQWLSWVSIDDLTDIYLRAIVDETMSGPVNAVSPNPVSGTDYARILARVLGRPAMLPVPREAVALVLGRNGADEFALASQRVSPAALLTAGHHFRWPDLEHALRHLLGRSEEG